LNSTNPPAIGYQKLRPTSFPLRFALGFAYVINFVLIASEGATGASVVTYLVPVTAALLGVAILGEPWTWRSVAGLIAILVGVFMARRPTV
jgi:drug/metabolite transporter (DMT)-like permease